MGKYTWKKVESDYTAELKVYKKEKENGVKKSIWSDSEPVDIDLIIEDLSRKLKNIKKRRGTPEYYNCLNNIKNIS